MNTSTLITLISRFYVGHFKLYYCTYHPRLVTEIVHRVQRVDTWQPSILKTNHHVPVVAVLVHAESMLPYQHKVWFEGSEIG